MHEIYWLPGCQPFAVYLLVYRNGSINKVNTLSIFNWGNFFFMIKYLISVWTLRQHGLYLIFLLSDSSQLSQYLTWKNCPYFQLLLLLWFWLSVQHLECVFWNWINLVLLPGKSHGWRSLEGCSPWGCWGSDTTEHLHFHFSLSCIGEGNGNPLQCSYLENPRDGGVWWAAVCGVTQSRTWLKWLSSSSKDRGWKEYMKDFQKDL